MTAKALPKISWKKALAASVVIHGAVFGLLAFAYGSGQTAGGEGMISLNIGGPAGEAGGFGEVQKEGRMGNAGAGGDGARQHAKERKLESADSATEKLADKTEGEALPEPPQPGNAEEGADEGVKTSPATEAPSEPEPIPEPLPKIAEHEPLKPQEQLIEEKLVHPPLKSESAVEEVKEKEAVPHAVPRPVKPKAEEPVEQQTSKPRIEGKKVPPSTSKTQEATKKETKPLEDRPQKKLKGDDKVARQQTAVKSETDGTKDGKARKVNQGSGGAVGASGSASGRAQEEGSGVGTGGGDFFGSGNFIDNGDGTYTARGSGGIPYKIKYEETPKYPRTARDLGFNKVVSVRIRFLVGFDGRVETAEVLTKKIPDLGFREAALEAIRKMEFEPIVYRGRTIKMYFVKRIVFQP